MAANWASINRRRRPFVVKYSGIWSSEYRALGVEFGKMVRMFGPEAVEQIDTLRMDGIVQLWMTMYIDCGTAFAKDAAQSMQKDFAMMERKGKKPPIRPTTVDEEMMDAWTNRMRDYAMNEAGEFIVSIQQTAKNEMRRIIADITDQVLTEGTSRDTMAKLISEQFADEWGAASKWMGRRVAQTEMIRASNYGTLKGIESLGIPYDRVWYTGGANIRDTHLATEAAGPVDQDEEFIVGEGPSNRAWFPGDPRLAPEESINCKCAVSARPKGYNG